MGRAAIRQPVKLHNTNQEKGDRRWNAKTRSSVGASQSFKAILMHAPSTSETRSPMHMAMGHAQPGTRSSASKLQSLLSRFCTVPKNFTLGPHPNLFAVHKTQSAGRIIF